MSIRLNLAGAAEKVERGGGPIRPTWKPDDGDFHVSFLILSQGLFPYPSCSLLCWNRNLLGAETNVEWINSKQIKKKNMHC